MKSRKIIRKIIITKTCSKQPRLSKYLPPEVLSQILATLPAKTLLRFRCVCKSWYSLINNPDFISMHFKLCNNNNISYSNTSKLLALEGLGVGGNSGCLLTLRKSGTLRQTRHIFKCSQRYYIYGKCDSLVLLCRSLREMYFGMRLCNPSIRKSLLLPPCPLLSCVDYAATFVLGFDRRSVDYKIFAITSKTLLGLEIPEVRVAVFTLSDQQWVVRDNGINIDYSSFKCLFGPYYFFEGAAHWLGEGPYWDINNWGKLNHLVSLDFDTENFSFFELPPLSDEVDASWSLFLLGQSLAVFCISPVSFKIWELKPESGKREWTLWFSGLSSIDGFELFDCMESTTQRVLYCEGNGDVGCLVYGNNSYNIATGQVQSFGKSVRHTVELGRYFESLVLCNGHGTEDMTSFPFILPKKPMKM